MAARIIVFVLLGMLAGWVAVEAQSEVRVSVSRSGDVETRTEELAYAQGSGAGPDPDLREINAGGRFLNMNTTNTTADQEVCLSVETEDGTPFPRRLVNGELVSAVSITDCAEGGSLLPTADAVVSEQSCGFQMAEICFEWQTLVTDGCDGVVQTTTLVRKFFDGQERGIPTRRVLVVNPVPLPPVVTIRPHIEAGGGGAFASPNDVAVGEETILVVTDEKQCPNRTERVVQASDAPDWVSLVDQGVDEETGVGTTNMLMNPTAEDVGPVEFTVEVSDGVDTAETLFVGNVVVGSSFELGVVVNDVRAPPDSPFSAFADFFLDNTDPEPQGVQGWTVGVESFGAATISSVQSRAGGLADPGVAFEKTELVDSGSPVSGFVVGVVYSLLGDTFVQFPPGRTDIFSVGLTGTAPATDGAMTTAGVQTLPTFQDSEGAALTTELTLPGGTRVPLAAGGTFSVVADSNAPVVALALEHVNRAGVSMTEWSATTNVPITGFVTTAQADDPENFPGVHFVPGEAFGNIAGGRIDQADGTMIYHVIGVSDQVLPAGRHKLYTSSYLCQNREVAVNARVAVVLEDGTLIESASANPTLSCPTSFEDNSCEGAQRLGLLAMEEPLALEIGIESIDPGPERVCPPGDENGAGGGAGNGRGAGFISFLLFETIYPTEESFQDDVRARGLTAVLTELLLLQVSDEVLAFAAWVAFTTLPEIEPEFEPQFLITAEIDPGALDPDQRLYIEVQRLLQGLEDPGVINCDEVTCEENLETFSGGGAGAGGTSADLVPIYTWEAQPDTTYLIRVAGDPGTYPVTLSVVPPMGLQLAGDCNQDGTLDVSDPLCMAEVLFLGARDFPCGDGGAGDPANLALLDLNGTGEGDPNFGIDLSDLISLVNFLFLGRAAPVQGVGCFAIAGCAENPGCAL